MSTAEKIGDYFDQIWHDTEGFVYLPVKSTTGMVRKFMIPWPRKREAVINHVLKYAADPTSEIFYSPALYSDRMPTNENVLGAWVAWADFDGNAPEVWPEDKVPLPSIEIQSSAAGKKHVYWDLGEFVPAKAVQEINRAIAYAMGADLSGWDANQFLRPPFTMNRKYAKPLPVTVLHNRTDRVYSPGSFDHVPKPKEAIQASVDVGELPSITEVLADTKWDDELIDLFRTDGEAMVREGRDRSGALQRLAYEGAERGWTDEQIMVVLLDADERWGKYVGRPSRKKILVDLINRARSKIGYNREGDLLDLAARFRDTPTVESEDDQVLFSVGELAAMQGIKDWQIEGVLTPRGIGLVTGRSGVGKTQLALQMAADIATGRERFLERPLPLGKLKVLVLSLEMNQWQLPMMMQKLAGRYPELDQRQLVVYAKGEMLPLNQEPAQAYLDSLLEKIRPDVVIADSLSFLSSADLTSDTDMKVLFQYLQKARNQFDFGMVIVHHHRKKANDAQSKKQPDTLHDVYGSYIVTSTVDFVLNLEERPDDVDEKTLTMSMLKSRYSAVPEPVKLHRNESLHFSEKSNLEERFLGAMNDDDEEPGLSLRTA